MSQQKGKVKNSAGKSLIANLKLFFEKHIAEKEFFRSKIVLWLLALNVVANIVNWVSIAIFINRLDGEIILHYNVYFGVDSMGDWRRIFILPIIGIILFAFNVALATYFHIKKERIASYILLLASFMAQINLIIAAASILMINY